jgi:hypothetical protein
MDDLVIFEGDFPATFDYGRVREGDRENDD